MYCEDGGRLQLQISPLFCKQNNSLTVPVATSIIVFSSPTYSITIINLTPVWWRSLRQQWAIGLYMGYMVIWAMYGLNDFGNKFLLLVPLFNCNTNVWPWKMNFSNIYNDIVVKIAEDGPCAEPRSRQSLPHISYHREQTLPASQVSCWDLEKITLFLGLSVVTKVRDPEVTIINLKLCRTFGPAVAVTILEGWRKYNKLTSPASEFSLQ